jgi:CubicO group peptidase (beta-lactamase class C family)
MKKASALVVILLTLASYPGVGQTPPPSIPAAAPQPAVRLAADTPETTTSGNTFVAPKDWTLAVKGTATILEAPEGGSWIALVDVFAKTDDEALAEAWKAYKPEAKWPVKVSTDLPDRDGWSKRRNYDYLTSPNEKRDVGALVMYSGTSWTVVIFDMDEGVAEKRGGQIGVALSRLLPKGYSRESFAGKQANTLNQQRIAELGRFIEQGQKETQVPGVALALVQNGKVIFAGGFGVKELGAAQKPDGDTLFMIASNTKALTTLMLAKLVEEHKMSWDTQVISLYPNFKLGDPATTKSVLVKHLICACTGMPRQDMEWLFQFGDLTPESAMQMLGTMQPTSKFGELFQYSNLMAAAAGYTGGHVLYPNMEVGAAYDKAMQTLVFNPLGMTETTFNYAKALKGDHATPAAPDVDGKMAPALMALNYAIIPARPAGAAWSSVDDMLKYVSMELADGKLPDGATYIAEDPLLERRKPQVALNKDATYGMGLMVDKTYGIPVVHHGGDMIGFHSDMIWLPQQNVGAVILTNGDPGWIIRSRFSRKLLEVLFDGRPEADNLMAADAKSFYAELAADRKLLVVPADASQSATLAKHYSNAALGNIDVSMSDGKTYFDFGEWKTEVASKKNPDGTTSFVTIVPGAMGIEFVVGSGAKKTLTLRDAQHEYIFEQS